MHVAVDAAGQHQKAGRVDDLAGVADVGSDGGDFAGRNPDIAGKCVGRGRNRAAADDGVERHADLLMRLIASAGRGTN